MGRSTPSATDSLAAPDRAYVQALAASESEESLLDRGANPFLDELTQVRQELRRRGVPITPVRPGDAWPDLDDIDRGDVFVFGDRHFIARVVHALGLSASVACSYPRALAGLLHRRHWQGVPRTLLRSPAARLQRLFVKPCCPAFRDGRKFEAEILDAAAVRQALASGAPDRRLCCSEVVDWMSEFRCYVLDSRVCGIHRYFMRLPDGWQPAELERAMPELRPTLAWVEAAVARLDAAGESVAGYCLDAGLIAFGEMSLVELNDGLALTNYGLSPSDYLDLHLARWRQLLAGRRRR